MTGGEIVGVIVWGLLTAYSAVAVFVPEIRIHWKRSDKKLGTVSSIGFAMFFWSPTLGLMGFIPAGYTRAMFLFVVLGIVIAGTGYVLDVVSPLDA